MPTPMPPFCRCRLHAVQEADERLLLLPRCRFGWLRQRGAGARRAAHVRKTVRSVVDEIVEDEAQERDMRRSALYECYAR